MARGTDFKGIKENDIDETLKSDGDLIYLGANCPSNDESDTFDMIIEENQLTTRQNLEAMQLISQEMDIFFYNDPDKNRSSKASRSVA